MSLSKVSIIIPSYSEKSGRYLELCLRSIRNLDYDQSLIDVVVSTPLGYEPYYFGFDGMNIKTIHHPNPNRQFAEAVNYGVQQSDQSSDFIFLLNDDTIMTKDSLKNLVEAAKPEDAIINPTSNCDEAWKYLLSLEINVNGETYRVAKRFLGDVDITGLEEPMMNARSIYPHGIILTDTLCFYATLMSRKVWNEVGELDEQFKTGYEDSDYSHRARLKELPLKIALDAIVWHFCGIATKECLTDEQTLENKRKFEEKWYK